jgi:hypothetical protein
VEIERLDRTIHSMCRDEPATRPSRPSTEWARCSPPSFWPRSGACTDSLPAGPLFLDRAHSCPPGVRCQGPPGTDHQAGLAPDPVGGHRGRGPLPRRRGLRREAYCLDRPGVS